MSFPDSDSRSNKVFEIDIWGPCSVFSMHVHRFFLTIVDDYSKFTWLFLLQNKSKVQQLIPHFCAMVETQFSSPVKVIRSDNEPEFFLTKFYSSKGILHQRVFVETPQQNSVVERKHQHLLNVTRSLLFQANFPKVFWYHAVAHATFLINRLPTPSLGSKTPYELLYNKLPDFSFLKTFGSLCYASPLLSHSTKLDPRARQCVFIGYRHGTNDNLLFDMKSIEVLLSRHVNFHETEFLFKAITHNLDTCVTPSLPTSMGTEDIDFTPLPTGKKSFPSTTVS